MKEYTLVRRYGDACPFSLYTYPTLTQAKEALNIALSNYRSKTYKFKNFYVDNEFFENKYPLGLPHQEYFQIRVREVSEWHSIDEKIIDDDLKIEQKKKCKIIQFKY